MAIEARRSHGSAIWRNLALCEKRDPVLSVIGTTFRQYVHGVRMAHSTPTEPLRPVPFRGLVSCARISEVCMRAQLTPDAECELGRAVSRRRLSTVLGRIDAGDESSLDRLSQANRGVSDTAGSQRAAVRFAAGDPLCYRALKQQSRSPKILTRGTLRSPASLYSRTAGVSFNLA